MGEPTSTVGTPSSAAVMGPMVLPQGRSLRTTKRWGENPAASQQSSISAAVAPSVA